MSEIREKMLELDYKNIGPDVSVCGSIGDSVLADISATCRRAFKKDEVVVYVNLDEDDDYDAGIVFTETSLIAWEDGGSVMEKIPYEQITTVDFDDDSVIINYAENNAEIPLGEDAEDEKYPRHMYSFVMDILELID